MKRPYFVHIRPMINPFRGISIDNIKPATRGGITVAIDGSPEDGYRYALSYCHPNDNYNKGLGRAKAGGRLNSPEYIAFIPISEAKSFKEAEAYVRNNKHLL